MHLRPLSTLGLMAAIALALGCSSPAAGPSSGQGDALGTAAIPKDFTFATTRPVTVHLSVKASALHAVGNVGGLQLRLPDGTEVYRGPIQADSPLDLTVTVPTKDKKLQATLFTGQGQKLQTDLDIADGKASKVFE